MKLTVRWSDFPQEIREAVEPTLDRYLWLVPGWCRVLHVGWCPQHSDGRNVPASSSATPEYLFGCVNVFASWLEDGEKVRANSIVHELLHLQLAEMPGAHQECIDLLLPDGEAPKLAATLHKARIAAMERTISNLTYCVQQLPPELLPATDHEDEVG